MEFHERIRLLKPLAAVVHGEAVARTGGFKTEFLRTTDCGSQQNIDDQKLQTRPMIDP